MHRDRIANLDGNLGKYSVFFDEIAGESAELTGAQQRSCNVKCNDEFTVSSISKHAETYR